MVAISTVRPLSSIFYMVMPNFIDRDRDNKEPPVPPLATAPEDDL